VLRATIGGHPGEGKEVKGKSKRAGLRGLERKRRRTIAKRGGVQHGGQSSNRNGAEETLRTTRRDVRLGGEDEELAEGKPGGTAKSVRWPSFTTR